MGRGGDSSLSESIVIGEMTGRAGERRRGSVIFRALLCAYLI